ncbi:ZIP zinc transporter-domain-containing protein [Collybia nuda]|uniref:ZIP zinc transporter-domain-containing protein n=1 Tax=Collybia nuda TaxID=64659 RepID=A0A9P6CP16_9AGAR|nr:ZIP zinc transporter-domain-containing protein [Collybia nuda]
MPCQQVPTIHRPTNSGTCTLHDDHYHCTGEAAPPSSPDDHEDHEGHGDHEDDQSGDVLGKEEVISDVGGEGCVQHGTHFHCPAGVQSSCKPPPLDYDLALHIGALFVLLVASFIGVVLPVFIGTRTNRIVSNVFFALKHFGTGIIISTAFIHLLMHAFVMFANECLGETEYEAIAPAIAMLAVMMVFAVDFFAARLIASKPSPGAPTDSTLEKQVHPPTDDLMALGHDHSCNGAVVAYDGSTKQAHWEVHLLEAGIIFHSIMIGVTLGAQGGSGFIPTFCAIVFHQFFEGLGLGARIAVLVWPSGEAYKKWLMCGAYTLVTPIGIAIGIGAQSSFNLNAKSTILAIGILNSISAGILLYTGIVRLLVMEWINGELLTASRIRVAVASVSLLLGLFAMSFIGKWA